MFTQNIFPRNFIRNAVGLQNCLSAENQDLIKIKYSIASVVENDTFVGILHIGTKVVYTFCRTFFRQIGSAIVHSNGIS